jgi:transposase
MGVVDKIATSTIWHWFSNDKLKPWRYHSWQHILDLEAFLKRARPVLQWYEEAKTLLEQGFWVVCADEKTSIQARQRPQSPEPACPGHEMHIASRYKRKGALHLFGALSVADGLKYGQMRLRKRFIDFQAFLLEVIIPAALQRGVHTLILILDNGPTHAPKQLEAWLQQQIAIHNWPLKIEVYWLPTNASWLNQIEIWFSVLQRKLLTPNHFANLRSLVESINSFIRFENRSAKPIAWSFTVEKLELKLGSTL